MIPLGTRPQIIHQTRNIKQGSPVLELIDKPKHITEFSDWTMIIFRVSFCSRISLFTFIQINCIKLGVTCILIPCQQFSSPLSSEIETYQSFFVESVQLRCSTCFSGCTGISVGLDTTMILWIVSIERLFSEIPSGNILPGIQNFSTG